ncbi:MAG: hypothetical protein AABW59_05340 [archaeon]
MPTPKIARVKNVPNSISGGQRTILKINSLTGRPIRPSYQRVRDNTASIIKGLRSEGKSRSQIEMILQKYSHPKMLSTYAELERTAAVRKKK